MLGGRARPIIEDLLPRIAWLVEEVPASAELDLNRVNVQPQGVGLFVVDACVRGRA
jgi:hypothetical protein